MAESLASGGSVSDAGDYLAGSAEGMDLIAVRDSGSGDEVVVQVHVYADAQLRGSPARLALPSGASVALHTQDGSGEVDWSIVSGPGSLNGAVFSTDAADSGSAVLEASDQFTQERTRVNVQILEELTHPSRPHGRLTDAANLVTGDFDGDGGPDVAGRCGAGEATSADRRAARRSSFKGAASGLPDKPTWTTDGRDRHRQPGRRAGGWRPRRRWSRGSCDFRTGRGRDRRRTRARCCSTASDKDGPQLIRPALTGSGRGNFRCVAGHRGCRWRRRRRLDRGFARCGSRRFEHAQGARRGGCVRARQTRQHSGSRHAAHRRRGLGGATASLKEAPSLRFGRAVAVADFNGDGRADLASLGAVNNALLAGTAQAKNQSAVAVHFGRASSPMFDADPDLYVLPANSADTALKRSWRIALAPAADGGATRLLLSGETNLDSPDLSGAGRQT